MESGSIIVKPQLDHTLSKDELGDVTWALTKRYYTENKGYQLVKHLVESFNDFVLRKLDHIIEGFNTIEICHGYIPELDMFKYILEIEMKNPVISKPMIFEKDGSTKIMTPTDARNRNFTYSGPLTIDMDIRAKTLNAETNEYVVEQKSVNNVALGKIPIMVNSRYCILNTHSMSEDECRYDFGGYFLINGNEKVIISQDRIAENKAYVFINNKVSAYSHIAEIRSVLENRFSVPKTTTLKLSSKPNQFGRYIRVNIHHIKNDIPLFILFRALGIESDKDVLKHVVYDMNTDENQMLMRELVGSIEEANTVLTTRDALEYLSRHMNINGYPREVLSNRARRLEILKGVLQKEFLPHVGIEYHKKALYLGYMVNKLVRCYMGLLPFDDRDSYINKRIDTPGILMANLFRQYYGKVVKDMKNMIQKDINSGSWKATNKLINVINKVNISKVVKSTIIESGLKYGLATGNWGIKTNKTKQGVAQVLNRLSYNATISHLRRINTPIDKTGKLIQPRKLHGTQMGVICPAETPEGVSVGLVKNLSVMGSVTISSDSTNLREILKTMDIRYFDGKNIEIFGSATKVLVNGDLIGVHDKPQELFDKIKFYKRKSIINAYTGVVWNIPRNELWICTEGGRCIRPVYIVDDGQHIRLNRDIMKKIMKHEVDFPKLVVGLSKVHEVDDSIIEFLDVEECNTSMIAMKAEDLSKGYRGALLPVKYTHLEMDPSLMMGVLAGSIPFSHHNQAPRNCYQCLWLEEEVLMANGMRKKIKDVQVGDEVVTFDVTTMIPSKTKVIHQYVRVTDKEIYELETISGRKIIATSNHPFMTSTGNKKVEDIVEGDCVGVYLHNLKTYAHDVDDCVVLDKTKMSFRLSEVNVNPSLIVKHAQKLKDLGIIPLTSTHTMLPIIARLAGYIATDGALNVYNKKHGGMTPQAQANFGSLLDAEMFEADIASLGFDKVAILHQEREIHGATHKTWKICHNGVFATLLVALGFHIGNKVKNPRQPIPDWIMNGSPLVKKEFLSAWQGGDGNQVYERSSSTKGSFYTMPVYQSIEPQFEDSLIEYMSQLEKLYNDVGVKTQGVRRMSSTNLQYGKYKIGLYMENSDENYIKIAENVGYMYSDTKVINTSKVAEYIRSRNYTQTDQSYKEFKETIKHQAYTIFVPIHKKTKVNNLIISDITVESDNHTFITTGGIMSFNSAMGKQAIGIYTSNYRKRYDTLGHCLNYPQVPLVQTRTSKIINTDKLPCGINAIVAIATYTGFNQEDSLIMNQSSVDRGMFISTYYRTYREQNNKNHSTGEEEYFCKPDPEKTKQLKPYNYGKLALDGFVPENTYVQSGDVMVGKCMPQKMQNLIMNKDTSVVLKNNEQGFIDRNCYGDKHFTNINGDGYMFAKVRMRSDRVPTIGDKFSCYTPDHDVLTNKGWIPIGDLTRDYKVASLVDGALVYQKPKEIQVYPYKGKIYCVKSNQVDLKVTPNHRMYVRMKHKNEYDTELAENIYGDRRCYKKNVERYEPNLEKVPPELIVEDGKIKYFQVPDSDIQVKIRPWLKFFGIWIAEGCTLRTWSVQFAAHKDRVKQALEEVCEQMGFDVHKHKNQVDDEDLNSWNIPIPKLVEYFKPLSVGAVNKSLPEWVWHLTPNLCVHLIEGMCLGDGHTMANGTVRYDTSSTRLADDFQRLCLHAGWSTNKTVKCGTGYSRTKKDGSKITTTTDAYRLTIIKSQNEPLVNKNKIVGDESSYLDSWEMYEGTVHCCTVPKGDGIIYVRRNGVTVWSGNSRHGQKGTNGMLYREEDMPFTKDGIRPDIIVNPHAIPSRMTIGQLMECIMGKACVSMGTYGDGTAFSEIGVEDIADLLEDSGFERYGNEILYNSRTGEQIPTEIFIGPTYYQRLKHMTADKMHCVTADHDVLTERGWIPIADVTMADRVATLVDGHLIYDRPTEIFHYPHFNGNLYHIANEEIDLNVTCEHRMWVSTTDGDFASYDFMKAQDIMYKPVRYLKNAQWGIADYQFVLPATKDVDAKCPEMNAWLAFMGTWLSTGVLREDNIVEITVSNEYKHTIIYAITMLGYQCVVDPDLVILIKDAQLYEYLDQEDHSKLPKWIWELSMEQCKWLIYHIIPLSPDKKTYFTPCEAFANDMMRLCLHAGWSANKECFLASQKGKHIWKVTLNDNDNVPRTHSGSPQIEEYYNYEGAVYCLQVPSEVFYVRRNGKACWTGNSRSNNGPVVMLTRQPAEGRARDGGLRLGEMEIECNWAHGIMHFLKERFMECSDNYRVYVCKKCGMIANVNPDKNIYQCKPCRNSTHFSEIRIPYACKLLFQEIQTMSIGAKFLT